VQNDEDRFSFDTRGYLMEIHRAMRKRAKLRLGLSGPSGSGKTYSSLLIAGGLGKRVGLIDTENGSGELYADSPDISRALPEGYDVITLQAPFEPKRYVQAIQAFERGGYDVIIIDSLSHAWAGQGGLLDQQGKIADRSGNGFSAWRQVTPEHNKLVDAILQSSAHMVVTMRSKTEYVIEQDSRGKATPRKVGLAPVMRDGIEYELTVAMDLGQDHNAQATKDRTGLFDGSVFPVTRDTGKKLLAWLESGVAEASAPAADVETPFDTPDDDNDDEDDEEELRAAMVELIGEIEKADDLETLRALKAEAESYGPDEYLKHFKPAVAARLKTLLAQKEEMEAEPS
jgi:hypothetical protein